jgi:hypothetical protein
MVIEHLLGLTPLNRPANAPVRRVTPLQEKRAKPEEVKRSASREDVHGDDREFGKNRTLSFASSCNQFIVFSMDERKWRKLFDKQIGIL